MTAIRVDACSVSYEVIGDAGARPWVITPGGRFSKDSPGVRELASALDRAEFIATMERWMAAYCPCGDELIPGLPDADARTLDLPTLVFRSGASDFNHTRATSENLAKLLRTARLVEPPWGDTEWNDRSAARPGGQGEGLFAGWPALAPVLPDWADEVLA